MTDAQFQLDVLDKIDPAWRLIRNETKILVFYHKGIKSYIEIIRKGTKMNSIHFYDEKNTKSFIPNNLTISEYISEIISLMGGLTRFEIFYNTCQ